SAGGGVEAACLSEASLRAVPRRCEKRRLPTGEAGRASGSGCAFFLVTFSLHRQRKSDSPKPRSGWRKLLLLGVYRTWPDEAESAGMASHPTLSPNPLPGGAGKLSASSASRTRPRPRLRASAP